MSASELERAVASALQEPTPQTATGMEQEAQPAGREPEASEGSALPPLRAASAAETGASEEQPSELEPGVVSFPDRWQDGDTEGADAALRAADRAKTHGSTDQAVLDALEAAETAHDSAHPADAPAGSTTRRLSARMEDTSASGGGQRAGDGKRKGGLAIEEASRVKIRQKLLAAVQRNPGLAGLPPAEQEAQAVALEAACQASSSSRPVYISKAGNIARQLARATPAELAELPRIAAGVAADSLK